MEGFTRRRKTKMLMERRRRMKRGVPRWDYSGFNPESIQTQIDFNRKAKLGEFIKCPICGGSEFKTHHRKIFCSKVYCKNIYGRLKLYGLFPKLKDYRKMLKGD
jgi:hypothetical protein